MIDPMMCADVVDGAEGAIGALMVFCAVVGAVFGWLWGRW